MGKARGEIGTSGAGEEVEVVAIVCRVGADIDTLRFGRGNGMAVAGFGAADTVTRDSDATGVPSVTAGCSGAAGEAEGGGTETDLVASFSLWVACDA